MAILDVVKQGTMHLKTASGYVKLLPRTLASLVSMDDGTSVEDAITELNSKFEVYTATATTTLSTTVYFYRIGKFVWMVHNGAFSLPAANTTYQIADIPSGYRPIRTCYQAEVSVTTHNCYAYARWHASTSSNALHITCNNAGQLEHYVTMCYLTEDELPSA